jgi:hypothetical protein
VSLLLVKAMIEAVNDGLHLGEEVELGSIGADGRRIAGAGHGVDVPV